MGDEWDWKGRVEVLDGHEDEDEVDEGTAGERNGAEGMDVEKEEPVPQPPVMPKRKWTLQEVATFQRTGRRPV